MWSVRHINRPSQARRLLQHQCSQPEGHCTAALFANSRYVNDMVLVECLERNPLASAEGLWMFCQDHPSGQRSKPLDQGR